MDYIAIIPRSGADDKVRPLCVGALYKTPPLPAAIDAETVHKSTS